jgi:hypothetical protein
MARLLKVSAPVVLEALEDDADVGGVDVGGVADELWALLGCDGGWPRVGGAVTLDGGRVGVLMIVGGGVVERFGCVCVTLDGGRVDGVVISGVLGVEDGVVDVAVGLDGGALRSTTVDRWWGLFRNCR